MQKNIYELVIIGLGPAGLCGSIYASRYGIAHLVIGEVTGGQISEAHEIDNYPGLPGLSGLEFAKKLEQHAGKYHAEILNQRAVSIEKRGGTFGIQLANEIEILAKTILLAGGTKKRKINITNQEKFLGKGVSYCATCDGFFYRGKKVAVIGGNDSAAGAAVYLANLAQEVILIYRKEKLRAENYWVKLIEKNSKIRTVFKNQVMELFGQDRLEGLILENGEKISIDGLFIEVGSEPDKDFLGLELEREETGAIIIRKDGQTSIDGIWAAGDITNGSDNFHQVVTAVAEGAIAARSIHKYLEKSKADEKH